MSKSTQGGSFAMSQLKQAVTPFTPIWLSSRLTVIPSKLISYATYPRPTRRPGTMSLLLYTSCWSLIRKCPLLIWTEACHLKKFSIEKKILISKQVEVKINRSPFFSKIRKRSFIGKLNFDPFPSIFTFRFVERESRRRRRRRCCWRSLSRTQSRNICPTWRLVWDPSIVS